MPEVRFRKLPTEITAIQWDGENDEELARWTNAGFETTLPGDSDDPDVTALLLTDHGWIDVKTGQWIARDAGGRFYLVAEDVLAKAYERLEASDGAD